MYFIARRFLRNGPEEQTRLYMTALFRSQYADKSSFELDGQLVNEAFVLVEWNADRRK